MVRPCSCPASGESGKGAPKTRSTPTSQPFSNAVAVIGIDIGKNSFHLVGLDDRGAIVLRQKWSRGQVEVRLANMPPCLIGMEAYVGAHHLSRKLKALGHDARLMPAKYVRPYSKGQKNDFRDVEAIAEAVQRPTMKFVSTCETNREAQPLGGGDARRRDRLAHLTAVDFWTQQIGVRIAAEHRNFDKLLVTTCGSILCLVDLVARVHAADRIVLQRGEHHHLRPSWRGPAGRTERYGAVGVYRLPELGLAKLRVWVIDGHDADP